MSNSTIRPVSLDALQSRMDLESEDKSLGRVMSGPP